MLLTKRKHQTTNMYCILCFAPYEIFYEGIEKQPNNKSCSSFIARIKINFLNDAF